jgi:polyribonucleotide nucleotidyltransferase
MHHYNFPPYSVGETGMMRGPKRRDIGHGALAQRALEAMIPPLRVPVHDPDRLGDARVERLVVDGLGLRLDAALMDAGVPIKKPSPGIAMGLVKEGDDYVDPHRHPGRRGPPR